MALHLEVSNSLEKLADNLIQKLGKEPTDIFTPITIVTQTEGINLWLRERIAMKKGIAANISFITPNDIVFKVFQVLGGQYEETISRDTMVWLLFQIMGEREFAQFFPKQWSYFQTPVFEKEKKRMGMAMKVADLFDQYQIYRQDEITKWNNSPQNKSWGEDDWQEYLWKKLKERAPKQVADKSTVRQFIHENIKKETFKEPLQYALDKVFLFGLSIFTNYHLDIIRRLGDIIPVYFYLLNPAPQIYWMEDVNEKQLAVWKSHNKSIDPYTITGNPVLTNWGKVLRNTFLQLFSGSDDIINTYNDNEVLLPQEDSLLHKVQADIFENRSEAHIILTDQDLKDESLTFHSNYTLAGEVDALYQYLVHLVDKKGEALSPRDISVMVSDIDKYAPYIRAVFDNAPYPFRYKIADASISEGDNLFSALKQLLELNEKELTSELVLQLLESSYIRSRFQLDDIELLRQLTKMANIRFGIDGAEDDDTYIVSWRYGIKRLMFGICMSDEPLTEWNGKKFFPLDSVEGNKSQQVIRFCHFVEILIQTIEHRKQERTPVEWKEYLLELVHNLIYQPNENTDEDYYTLIEQLSRFAELDNVNIEKVTYEVFRLNFIQSLETTHRSSLFINDGITFCSLIPMRSVPFKVIAMLGLAGNKFPRREQPVSFSLLAQTHLLGDRNVKDNDKHLFLETLLSARDYLYISYIGKSVKDNSVIPPSVLVDELLDYIGQMAGKNVEETLVTQYPLHSYSHRYNDGDKLFRYSADNKVVDEFTFVMSANSIIKSDIKEEQILQDISLDSIISFFKNAPKIFYNKVLGIYYEQDSILLPETEDFSLDNWQSTLLKSEWFAVGKIEEDLVQKWKLTGKLPLKNVGEMTIENIENAISPVVHELEEKFPEILPHKLAVSIPLNEQCTLSGELSNVYENGLIAICFSHSYVKSMVEAFVKALVGIAMEKIDNLLFLVAVNEKKSAQVIFNTDLSEWNKEKAINQLIQMCALYQDGLKRPYPFAEIFYRETDPKKQKPFTADDLKKKGEDKQNSFIKKPLDEYIKKENERKFYEDVDVAERYNKAFELVIRPLFTIFPNELWEMVNNTKK